ncbi:hypothetical protein LWI29_019629 [Acer saccharum]|uniref:DUF8040 domain-containing protein n=1 Tax=Acer saccharum TaxID=4024 RepID=A0AA39TFS3_ACESA|nr:hypothetical protein LWI29_019629 [Acer saccharum]
MFLFIVAHSVTSRIVAERFQHSTETVHRQFKRVLKAICGLAPHIIRPSTQGETPPEIRENPKYYPYFQISSIANPFLPPSPANLVLLMVKKPSRFVNPDGGGCNDDSCDLPLMVSDLDNGHLGFVLQCLLKLLVWVVTNHSPAVTNGD